jgi:hypothetical protein
LPQSTPPKLPTRGLGSGPMLCPSCNGDSFTERSSFKTASEPVFDAPSTGVTIDLMSCKRCGLDIPAVRGRRHYTLVSHEKLAALFSDLDDAKRVNSDMERLLGAKAKRLQGLSAETEECREAGELSVLGARVSALEAQTRRMEERRARLAGALEFLSSKIPA